MRGIEERPVIRLDKKMDEAGEGVMDTGGQILSFTMTSRVRDIRAEVGLVVTEIVGGEVERFRSGPTIEDLRKLKEHLYLKPYEDENGFRLV